MTKIYISVTDYQNQKNYLFDSQPNLFPTFPFLENFHYRFNRYGTMTKIRISCEKTQDNSIIVYKIN